MQWWYGKEIAEQAWRKHEITSFVQAERILTAAEWHLKELGTEDVISSNTARPRYKVSYHPTLVDYKINPDDFKKLQDMFSQYSTRFFPDQDTPVMFPPLTKSIEILRSNADLLKLFLRLAPVIYGTDLDKEKIIFLSILLKRIANPDVIQNTVQDIFHNHLYPQVKEWATQNKDVFILNTLESVKNQFFERVVKPSLQLKQVVMSPGDSLKELYLEEVPPLVALFRAEWTGDCSRTSVPTYVLSPAVKVYYIRKFDDFETRPVGYVLVLNVKLNGKTLPYVLTTNGNLSAAEVRGLTLSLAKLYSADEIIVPNFKINHWMANTDNMRFGMTSFSTTPAVVEIPESFRKISELRRQYSLQNSEVIIHKDYYAPDSISQAKLVKLSEQKNPQAQVTSLGRVNRYKPMEKPEQPKDTTQKANNSSDRFAHLDRSGRRSSFTEQELREMGSMNDLFDVGETLAGGTDMRAALSSLLEILNNEEREMPREIIMDTINNSEALARNHDERQATLRAAFATSPRLSPEQFERFQRTFEIIPFNNEGMAARLEELRGLRGGKTAMKLTKAPINLEKLMALKKTQKQCEAILKKMNQDLED